MHHRALLSGFSSRCYRADLCGGMEVWRYGEKRVYKVYMGNKVYMGSFS